MSMKIQTSEIRSRLTKLGVLKVYFLVNIFLRFLNFWVSSIFHTHIFDPHTLFIKCINLDVGPFVSRTRFD